MKKFKFSVLIVMVGTLISKIFGLLREILLAQKYGTGYISDSFILSLNIPTVLISAIAGAILINYIPVFAQTENESSDNAKKFNGNLISICFIISSIIVVLFMIFVKPIVKMFAVGFEEEKLKYIITLSKITIFSIYFIINAHILKGFLEYKGKFIGTSLYGILLNIGLILGIIFSSTERYDILGYGVLLGYGLSFIALIILAKINKFQLKLNIDFKDKYFKKLCLLTIPILLNDVVWQINGIIDKSIASTIGEGYISAINYSHYIVDMVASVFATSVITVFFPNIVKIFNNQGIEAVKDKTRQILKTVIFIAVPCTILISVLSENIVRVLFYRGAFNDESLLVTSTAVTMYSFAITFVCIKKILFKVFYALQDTKSPTKSAIIAIICNIIFTIILVKPFGYIGIIFGTIISSIISTIMLFKNFKKRYSTLIDKKFLCNIIKIICSAIIMLIAILIINNLTTHIYIYNELITYVIRAIIGAVISGIVYILTLVILKYDFSIKK